MISEDREKATPVYRAEQVTINDHAQLKVNPSTGSFLDKPGGATHIKLQPLFQNVRYRIDGGQATSFLGFQLKAGQEITLPVPNNGISVAEEKSGAEIEYQWLR